MVMLGIVLSLNVGQGTITICEGSYFSKSKLPLEKYVHRVYPVMENLEKSSNSIFYFQAWKSHGN